jgi:hypothetical protein
LSFLVFLPFMQSVRPSGPASLWGAVFDPTFAG